MILFNIHIVNTFIVFNILLYFCFVNFNITTYLKFYNKKHNFTPTNNKLLIII